MTVPPSPEVHPELSSSFHGSIVAMEQSKHISGWVFSTGEVAEVFCDHCTLTGSLCIVSGLTARCGLCLRRNAFCSFSDSPNPSLPNHSLKKRELHSDFARALSVVKAISEELLMLSSGDPEPWRPRTLLFSQGSIGLWSFPMCYRLSRIRST